MKPLQIPHKHILATLGGWLVLLFPAAPALAADPGGDVVAQTAAEAPLSRAQGDAILRELRVIRAMLGRMQAAGGAPQAAQQRRGPAPFLSVSTKGKPVLGAADAPVTVVEFSDFECPYCKRFSDTVYPRLKQDYIDTGKVRWITSDLPLGFHKEARKAAQASHCAGEQGRYWEMRELLFQNAKQLGEDKLPGYARQLGLDDGAFDACLGSDRHLAAIDAAAKQAMALGVTGTPAFVVGPTAKDTIKGRTIVGAQELGMFEAAIKQAAGQGSEGSAE